jgi:hypothetical protein
MAPLPGSTLQGLDTMSFTVAHLQFFDTKWAEREEKLLARIRRWAKAEFNDAHEGRGNVFYPFAGADFMTIAALYPNAEQYLMFGLEREGPAPGPEWLTALNRNIVGRDMENFRVALDDILGVSFFMTNDMQGDLTRSQFQGTTPILLAFIARSGYTVLKVEQVMLNREGKVVVNPNPPVKFTDFTPFDTLVTGMRIFFTGQDTNFVQQLVYVQCDISNEGLNKTPGFVAYMKGLKPASGFVKSASYLMHYPEFHTFRDIFMEACEQWLQDDTGVMYRDIDQNKYSLAFYGKYLAPIPLFHLRAQADLKQAFASNPNVKPLDFGMGYTWRPENCNLLFIRHKRAAAPQNSPNAAAAPSH